MDKQQQQPHPRALQSCPATSTIINNSYLQLFSTQAINRQNNHYQEPSPTTLNNMP